MSYRQMAQVYDRLMQDAPYEEWVDWTRKMLASYSGHTERILDLGCGTGEITIRLAKKGYDLTGVDLSADMLAIASQKDKGRKVHWSQQDISELEGLTQFDCAVSFCDVINYIPDESRLQSVFSNAYKALNQNGLFLFDVHSIEHILQDLYGQTFAEVYDDMSYIWFCDPGDTEYSMVHDLTFFVHTGQGFERFDETHEQKGYTLETLLNLLEKTGFSIKLVTADFSETPVRKGDRLFFVCQKQ
ncbi:class I SAM-dependent methyltransferase [Halobacillus sp. Marseille-Q1614]|uniref:class I SAM-dependent DNA methyltransferase n=1 Tax=Halobacillus sp. Marseille-Q1614 TaxID=2709134 RepID=UPI0020C3429B|nr:class I SAM-dependent methyltransferase [Halobacillus sp. Marseille-Q1614]